MNHCSPDIPGPFWWTKNHHHHHQQQQPPFMEPPPKTPSSHHHSAAAATAGFNVNLNNQEDDEELAVGEERENPEDEQFEEIVKEPMFEKPLTPSDVGKLNRLVIPKQHAEKYFPLGGGGSEKGLLLSFEDESGKLWRFRYSYWNSSQSYVLTKGWSRFVKEKRLDAGDVVLFERHPVDADRLFIGWRRRSIDGAVAPPGAVVGSAGGGRGGGWTRVFYSAHSYPSHPPSNNGPHAIPIPIAIPIPYQPDCLRAGTVVQNQTTPSSGNSKRLRLFGVNLECQTDGSEPSTPDGSSMSSQGQAHCQYCTINNPHASNHHQSDSMDINYYRQG
ncbi:hypothetical protein CsSME_00016649 [Camellia sinensis var. sinensis]|uniref:B3 domain-containing protein At2g36080-like n=1 Tax=Camellia sinensis TaxID=4442 RepID=UPI00103572A5|nr:B3 domain-containing protein At2g36080-like [Camellia sinensis]